MLFVLTDSFLRKDKSKKESTDPNAAIVEDAQPITSGTSAEVTKEEPKVESKGKTDKNKFLAQDFRKWILIDFWITIVGSIAGLFYIKDLMHGILPSDYVVIYFIVGLVLSIIFANLKKYFLLTILGIYEELRDRKHEVQ